MIGVVRIKKDIDGRMIAHIFIDISYIWACDNEIGKCILIAFLKRCKFIDFQQTHQQTLTDIHFKSEQIPSSHSRTHINTHLSIPTHTCTRVRKNTLRAAWSEHLHWPIIRWKQNDRDCLLHYRDCLLHNQQLTKIWEKLKWKN